MITAFCIGVYVGGAVVEAATDYFSGVSSSAKDLAISGAIWPYTLVSAFIKTR
jgi:hypothetical protein